MSDNFKPCPFCGGPASAFRLRSWTVPSVRCQNNCTDETDIEEWNARPIEDDLRARAEAAEARAAQAEAAGYQRAIDEACAAVRAERAHIEAEGAPAYGGYDDGRCDALREVEQVVRKLAPVEPVSPADGLPGGDR